MIKYEVIPIHFVNELKTEFYSMYDTDSCDRSDLAGLNIDLKSEKITFLLDISSSEIGLNEGWTHIIKDADGFYFAVEMNYFATHFDHYV